MGFCDFSGALAPWGVQVWGLRVWDFVGFGGAVLRSGRFRFGGLRGQGEGISRIVVANRTIIILHPLGLPLSNLN